jgi:hypothetical protein
MKSYNNIYLGICVQNNDPEYRGRIKVWVPHVSINVYNKWNQLKQDRHFKFPGLNINSDLSLIIDELRDELPWAEYCSPIAGGSASGTYNAFYETATVSDATFASSLTGTNDSATATEYELNAESFGEKPGAVFEKYNFRVTDAFTDTQSNKTSKLNPYGSSYRPSTYSNAAKGVFAVPNVGAHVWVFFRDGIATYPVYVGSASGEDDFKSIFMTEDGSAQDYPGAFENMSPNIRGEDISTQTYRNKMVINQRGAAIEIINTMDRERFKITHFAGGFIEFNNAYNSLFSPKNLQQLTLKDKFETINGHSNHYIGRDYDNIVKGDYLLKIGSLNFNALKKWHEVYKNIADILAQPENTSDKSSLQSVIESNVQALAEAERELGYGGNFIQTVTKHQFSNTGLIFNDVASYRINDTPKKVNQFRNVNNSGTILTEADIDLIEYTYVDDPPGGNFTQTIGNRYSLVVGSGGIDTKTTGPINLGGTIMAIAGTQVNIASKEDFNLDGGTNLSVIADIIAIRTRNKAQVVIDDNLGISKNVVIGGGSYTNGEVYLQHVTAPYEFQVTESTTIQDTGYTISNAIISNGIITKPGGGVISSGNVVTITGGTISGGVLTINQPHTHYFKNLPLTLVANAAAVRTAAAGAVNAETSAATATAPATHYNSAGGNLNSNPNGPINGVPG